jgi:valyl-tRNA synthetase
MDKRFEHTAAQEQAQALWEKEQTYTAANNPGPLYSVDTPPPTVSGSLHIGHIFSYTQTDIIARYKRMNGHSVYYPFGFDDNGLPTERYVEKKIGKSAHQFSRSEFINLCLNETHEAEEQFKNLWQRMGLSADWNKCYSTISDRVRAISQESFIRLYKKGFIYRKQEPALFCTTCQTSVAQAELDDVEKDSFFNDIVFKDHKGNDLLIGTTRPELLSSCVALFYNPDDVRYQHLKGTRAIVPIYEYEVPIFADEAVNPEKGTGLVMCCTFGDKTDIEWYKKYTLPYKESILPYGKWTENTGVLAGLKVEAARATIIEVLKEKNLLIRQRPIKHSVNVHERCKKEIEYIEVPQWFLNIMDHKEKLLSLADQINWYPAFMKSRYKNWVENIGWDWGLSRQRFFGIPFPAWHCMSCKTILLADISQLPIDPQETQYPGKTCPHCNSADIKPDTDVMDTWNTSSLTPYICASYFYGDMKSPFEDPRIQEFLPMSMRPQAHDIIRTWAFYTIIKAWMHNDEIPWHNIVISGHVLSDSKEKLSKSKGQKSLTPDDLLAQYPADAIRYWTASGTLGQDTAFSEQQLKIGMRLITKLWNAFIFTKDHIESYDPKSKVPEKLGVCNEWILDAATKALASYENYFKTNEYSLALNSVEQFFWNDFCDNYLEIIKDQLFNPHLYDAQEVEATRYTLYTVGLRILQLYAPYLPFVTETIYQELYKKSWNVGLVTPQQSAGGSLHQTRFDSLETKAYEESANTMRSIIEIIGIVRKLKTEKQLSLKADINTLVIYTADAALHAALKHHEQLIKGATRAQTIMYEAIKHDASALEQTGETWNAHVVLIGE